MISLFDGLAIGFALTCAAVVLGGGKPLPEGDTFVIDFDGSGGALRIVP